MILKLKALNLTVNVSHFKIESICNVTHMVQYNSWIDLMDAFYSTPVKIKHQNFLKNPFLRLTTSQTISQAR